MLEALLCFFNTHDWYVECNYFSVTDTTKVKKTCRTCGKTIEYDA